MAATLRVYATALIVGALTALALPPFHWLAVLPCTLGVLYVLVDAAPTRRSVFLRGWWFGFGYFSSGLYWLAFSFLVEAERSAWLIPFALPALAATLAVYIGLAVWLWRWATLRFIVASRSTAAAVAKAAMFAALWTIAEAWRGLPLDHFPWNPLATVWVFSPAMLQSVAVAGVWGLSLFTVFAFVLPAAWLREQREVPIKASVAALAFLFLLAAAGALRLAAAEGVAAADGRAPSATLRLIQPHILQRDKWKPELFQQHFLRHLRLSLAGSGEGEATARGGVRFVVWPETAVPYFLTLDKESFAAAGDAVALGLGDAPFGTGERYLVTGAPLPDEEARRGVYNGLVVIDRKGEVRGVYHKVKLVPFGEYVLFADVFPFLHHLGRWVAGNFIAGKESPVLAVGSFPGFRPLICYEAVFPSLSSRLSRGGGEEASWLLNITNDAWFGVSTGPWQHLAHARLRGVEQGLPLARAANTGVSALFDAYGRLRHALPLGARGFIDAPLPPPTPAPTFYAVWGDVVPAGLIFVFLLLPFSMRGAGCLCRVVLRTKRGVKGGLVPP